MIAHFGRRVSAAEIVDTNPTLTVDNVRAAAYGTRARQAGDPRTVRDLVKLKLDENTTVAAKPLLAVRGHECHTDSYRKMGVSTRAAAALFAMHHGLVTWPELPFGTHGPTAPH